MSSLEQTTAETQATTEAPPSGNPAAVFGLKGSLFIAQLINFAIVLFVLNKWVFKPLLKTMDARGKKIEDGLKNAAEAKKQLANAEVEHDEKIKKARAEARTIVNEAKERAETEHAERVAASKAIIEDQLEDAKERAIRERDDLKAGAMRDVAKLVVEATEKVAPGAIDEKAHRALIADAISELQENAV